MASSGDASPLISVLLPTRGRPQLAAAFLRSLMDHAAHRDAVEIVLYTDADDPDSRNIDHPDLEIVSVVGAHRTMGAINTAALRPASGDIIVLANDDIVVQTVGWDDRIRDVHRRFADAVYLAWPNDLFASGRMSTFPVLSRSTCELLGDPFPAEYHGAFIDYELFDMFTRLRRLGHDRMVYLDDVRFEHRHHRTGHREFDDTARRRDRWRDDITFVERRSIRQEQAKRLATSIEGGTVSPLSEDRVPFSQHGAGRTIAQFAAAFLGDPGLPFRRRLYLFTWFCGRYAAARTAGEPLPQR